MAGIVSYGAYIPRFRLSRAEIARAWGRAGARGEKAIASYDEDSITMALAAALDCTKGFNRKTIDGVYFASTTSPFIEKQAATIVAAAMGLSKDTLTMDFGGSIRAGTNALRSALDAVAAGSAKSILVVVADTRMGMPNGTNEMDFGDGAVALLVGTEKLAVTVGGKFSISNEMYDYWRPDGERFVRSWEERFGREAGYSVVVPDTINEACVKFGVKPSEFSKVCLYSPEQRQLAMVAKKAGFDDKGGQVEDGLYESVGNTGSALALMIFVSALEKAKEGDTILVVNFGDGCDVFSFRVESEIESIRDRRGIRRHLEAKRAISSYGKYMLWRELTPTQPPPRPPIVPVSVPALWRDREWGLSLHGSKCNRCGTPQYPIQRVCVVCQSVDDYEKYPFYNKKATLFTFSHDNLAAALDPPTTICNVDFEGGGRMLCDMADSDPEEVATGMDVEMTFRKLHYVNGIHNYWWKCSPVRC